jgi:hypothetical protein
MVAKLDAAAAQALARTQGVVAIEESRPTMKLELRRSLPSVGMPLDRSGINEMGEQTIVAIIDDGLDPFHQAFTDENGKSRIDLYWDLRPHGAPANQVVTYSPAAAMLASRCGLATGTLYVGADFDDTALLDPALRKKLRQGVLHGTAVASIAAGRATGVHPNHFCGGLAPGAKLIVIRLDGDETSTGSPAGYMLALNLIEKRAAHLGLPVVVNISNGISGGAHDGTAPVELQCGNFVDKPWRVIVKSAGNDRNEGRHAQFKFDTPGVKVLRWLSRPTTDPPQPGFDELEIWCGSFNRYEFTLEEPDRRKGTPFAINGSNGEHLGTQNDMEYSYEVLSKDNRKKSRIVLRIKPGRKRAVQPGEWRLHIRSELFRSSDTFHAWLTEAAEPRADLQDGCGDRLHDHGSRNGQADDHRCGDVRAGRSTRL